MRLARDKVEKEENLSKLEKEEMNWIKSLKESREKSLNEKMIQLKVSQILNSDRSAIRSTFFHSAKFGITSKMRKFQTIKLYQLHKAKTFWTENCWSSGIMSNF